MWSRREFLARVGVLGAALVVTPSAARAAGPAGELLDVVDDVAPTLHVLVTDTFAGLAAFVCPGPDEWSVTQGETDDAPGGVAADAHGFLAHALDEYLPFPDAILRPLARSLGEATTDTTGLPPTLAAVGDETVRALDDALASVLANDATVPASVPSAMLLNLVATRVDPTSLAGPHPSPFANLDMAGKAGVFAVLDSEAAPLLASLDHGLDEPARAAASGLVRFLSAALVHFTAFGVYCEWGVRGEERGTVTARPVGWDLTAFTPGEQVPADGWDELRGWWRDHRVADDAPVFPRPRGADA